MRLSRALLSISIFASLNAHAAFDLPLIPPSETPLWSSRDTISIRLEANFKELLAKYRTLAPQAGRQSSNEDAAFVNGTLIYKDAKGTDVSIELRLRARGHTSLEDCDFPKLDVEFLGSRKNTLFAKTKKIKIGTHCADVDGTSGSYGRLRNQLEPHREALAYELLEKLGVKSFKARAARITYVFNDAGKQEILRNAFFLETIGEAEQRYQASQIYVKDSPESKVDIEKAKAKGLEITEFFIHGLEKANVNETLMASLGNILLSNFDYIIQLNEKNTAWGRPLWNMRALLRADGTKFVMPYDFDLAFLVRSPVDTNYFDMYLPTLKESDFKDYPDSVAGAKELILSKRDTILNLVDQTDFSYPEIGTGLIKQDEAGRAAIRNYVEEMMKAVATYL